MSQAGAHLHPLFMVFFLYTLNFRIFLISGFADVSICLEMRGQGPLPLESCTGDRVAITTTGWVWLPHPGRDMPHLLLLSGL